MNKRNFQKELEKLLAGFEREERKPSLLLHSCCAPCSSYCLEYLASHFEITDFFFNPNISPRTEYEKRVEEMRRFLSQYPFSDPIRFLEGNYEPESFFREVKGLEQCPEGGERCRVCFTLRLKEAVRVAEEENLEYVTTTLTISPLKNAQLINAIGEELCEGKNVKWLPTDFKKKNGYKRSVELSSEYDLYRQNFCGCVFSKNSCNRNENVID